MSIITRRRLGAASLVLALAVGGGVAGAAPTGKLYKGYIDEALSSTAPYTDDKVGPLVVESEGGDIEVTYCFNQELYQPVKREANPVDKDNPLDSGIGLRFEEHVAESLTSYAHKAREGADQGVLNVIKNGYPVDAAGIQGSQGLTDEEFRYATQLAVWYWSDSYAATTYDDYLGAVPADQRDKVQKAYESLTGQDTSVELVKVDPADATLRIYTPTTTSGEKVTDIQNLLGVTFVNPSTGEPIDGPSEEPSQEPSEPTDAPSQEPSEPTDAPSQEPSEPTDAPSQEPSEPTDAPSQEPSEPTDAPSQEPSEPTDAPSQEPSEPTDAPTSEPSEEPSVVPTDAPTTSEPAPQPVGGGVIGLPSTGN